MDNKQFSTWCRKATGKIKFPPDREAVAEELRAHMEDHFDALIAAGLRPSEAAQQSLAAMGSAEEIAPQLAALHKPFWGYLHRTAKITAIITSLIAGILLLFSAGNLLFDLMTSTNNPERLLTDASSYEVITSGTQHDLAAENGYLFWISDYILYEDLGNDRVSLGVELHNFTPPGLDSFNAIRYFRAIDNLGNTYDSYATAGTGSRHISLGGYFGSNCGYSCTDLYIRNVPQDVQWVEIRYDRDGRDIVFHIDLSGGDRE